MWTTAIWALLVCASVCTVGSLLGSHPHGRMWRIDVIELRQRSRMIEVLEKNTGPLRREAGTIGTDDFSSPVRALVIRDRGVSPRTE
ncbi:MULTISPECIES: hypothetical protein [unclassified Streptomyces]|uniref:hypothetical protein n=1 Tax=unclassified Streptomyces TaxID=2593676 RepID=UPI002E0F9117|nr:hypothetical protein OG324_48000 [Streptomyces sp. NBC_01236]